MSSEGYFQAPDLLLADIWTKGVANSLRERPYISLDNEQKGTS